MMPKLWLPPEMAQPPQLPSTAPAPIEPRYALLINPFYPKDPHADSLAMGDGVQLWPRILADVESGNLQPRYYASYENNYSEDPAPRRSILPRKKLFDDHQSHRHSRMP